jgi:hypothetical protein
MLFGDGIFGKQLGLEEAMSVGFNKVIIVLIRRDVRELPFPDKLRCRKKLVIYKE